MSQVLAFSDVILERDGRCILDGVSWRVRAGERWVVLGPNGSGKTSLIRLAAGYLHPTRGRVEVLGHRLGHIDVRELRHRLGLASGALAGMLRPGVTAREAVMTGKYGALEPWWHVYDDEDRRRALRLLDQMGCGHLADQPLGTVSDGERQRVQLARTLMVDPELLLLDEPTSGLDVGGREALITRLSSLAVDPQAMPIVLVTHHVEEIPPGFTHLLLLAAGRVFGAGPLPALLTTENLSACFRQSIRLDLRHGRYLAWSDA